MESQCLNYSWINKYVFLDELLAKLLSDGPSLRTRRTLGLSQIISRDLIPLLVSASEEQTVLLPKLIKIFSYLTAPVECLISTDYSSSEEGQVVVYEVESLLKSIKTHFTEFNVTKAVVEFLKHVTYKTDPLNEEESDSVSDALLLLRNILHIRHKDASIQHQILWNLFAHSNFTLILLNLMTCEQNSLWGIALVQLIALIYKDQHVAHLQKLLNLWLENSLSESSEMSEDLDNESNTSPPDHSSSPTLTSDPTSDSSDTGGNAMKSHSDNLQNSGSNKTDNGNCRHLTPPSFSGGSNKDVLQKVYTKAKPKDNKKGKDEKGKLKEKMIDQGSRSDVDSGVSSSHFSTEKVNKLVQNGEQQQEKEKPRSASFTISYGQECCNSASSNEDETTQQTPTKVLTLNGKPRPTKLSNQGQSKAVSMIPKLLHSSSMSVNEKRELKRKKLHKRSRAKTTNLALIHHIATEDDISYVLREFTVDFLLKGYGSLVAVLQEQLSHNASLQMDKSHFLWLITYFLKFASQMELDLKHIVPVLNPKLLSYLTFEGVSMCEKLAICKDDPKPHLRRMHLVVTALREFVQAVEIYSKLPSCSKEDKLHINALQYHMLGLEELRNLFILLIKYFKPEVHSKQYLQDLVITNHVFLLLLEKLSSSADYKGDFKLCEFVKEFASPLIMQQYGNLLEDFQNNGEFVNDCVFTMMHHIAGDLNCPEALYQPSILKTFSNIWEVEFSIRDDWADLIDYVIQRFMKASNEEKQQLFKSGTSNDSDDVGWSKEDFNNLYWYYSKCSKCNDPISKILELYAETASGSGKTRESILNQLLHQRIIGYNQFLRFLRVENEDSDGSVTDAGSSSSHATAGSSCCHSPIPLEEQQYPSCELLTDLTTFKAGMGLEHFEHLESINENSPEPISLDSIEYNLNKTTRSSSNRSSMQSDSGIEVAIGQLINEIADEGLDLSWLQSQVLEACYVKFNMEVKQRCDMEYDNDLIKAKQKKPFSSDTEFQNVGAIPYHYSLLGQSIPIIPWTHWQEILLQSPLYLLLLHKLGFHLPCDVGKLFPRIPHFWNAEILLSTAVRLGPLPSAEKMKFDPVDVTHAMELGARDDFSSDVSSIDDLGQNVQSAAINQELTFKMSSLGVGVGSGFVSGHSTYGLGSALQSVNWMNLVHTNSKQFAERNNNSEWSSLKALPPTDRSISEITMMSQGSHGE